MNRNEVYTIHSNFSSNQCEQNALLTHGGCTARILACILNGRFAWIWTQISNKFETNLKQCQAFVLRIYLTSFICRHKSNLNMIAHMNFTLCEKKRLQKSNGKHKIIKHTAKLIANYLAHIDTLLHMGMVERTCAAHTWPSS